MRWLSLRGTQSSGAFFLLFVSLLVVLCFKQSYYESDISRSVSYRVVIRSKDRIINQTTESEFLAEIVTKKNQTLQKNGVGDSGTRAVWSLLSKVGISMGKPGVTVKQGSKDSKIFMGNFSLLKYDGTFYDLSAAKFYNKGLASRRTFNSSSLNLYSKESMDDPVTWNQGLIFCLDVLITTLESYRRNPLKMRSVGLKHPRTSLMLPFFQELLGDKLKFILVVRDGREITVANHQEFYRSLCHHFIPPGDVGCRGSNSSKLKFWSRINSEIIEWSQRHLSQEQFTILRIEDLVDGRLSCVRLLLGSIGSRVSINSQKFSEILQTFELHNESYFGKNLDEKSKIDLTQQALEMFDVEKFFVDMGYQLDAKNFTPDTFC